jgi:ADP-heptose:LPS heptosyltransferase
VRHAPSVNLPDWSAVRSVLLIRLRSIGDTVLMTPCLDALKAWRPDIEVAVVTEPLAAPILADHPQVDRLFVTGKSLTARTRLIRELRRARYDAAFNLHGGTTATTLARLAGAKWTVGYRGYRHSQRLDLRAPDPDVILGRESLHSVEQQLALLHWAGVPWPVARPQLSLNIADDAECGMREKLEAACRAQAGGTRISGEIQQGRFAIIAPAAAFESKRWTEAGFIEVAAHLRERWRLASIIVAGPGQEELAATVARQAGAVQLGGLTLKELMALINRSRAFIGNDSGPMHIAAAFKRPLVAVFGSSNVSVWHPWTDSPYRIIGSREPEAGGRKDTNTPDADGSFAIRRVPAREVIAGVDEVLELSYDDAGASAR